MTDMFRDALQYNREHRLRVVLYAVVGSQVGTVTLALVLHYGRMSYLKVKKKLARATAAPLWTGDC